VLEAGASAHYFPIRIEVGFERNAPAIYVFKDGNRLCSK
jgi:hypothetical protein